MAFWSLQTGAVAQSRELWRRDSRSSAVMVPFGKVRGWLAPPAMSMISMSRCTQGWHARASCVTAGGKSSVVLDLHFLKFRG